MALQTTLQQLEEVQEAISAVLFGQSYTLSNGTSVTKADLNALQAREDKLLARYRSEQGRGGMTLVTGIPRRS